MPYDSGGRARWFGSRARCPVGCGCRGKGTLYVALLEGTSFEGIHIEYVESSAGWELFWSTPLAREVAA